MTESRVVIVTGGAGSLGTAIARRFAVGGDQVAIWDNRPEEAAHTVATITAEGGRASEFAVDVSAPAEVEAATKAVVERMGIPAVLINCAGIRDQIPLLDVSPAAWRRVLAEIGRA